MNQPDPEALARDHLELVEKLVAIERMKLGPGVDPDELRSYALEGLAKAIDRFDPELGFKFKTFAQPKIRGAIYDGLAQAGWLPRRLHRKIKFYRKADDALEARASEPPPRDAVDASHRLVDAMKELATVFVTDFAAEPPPEHPDPAQAELEVEKQVLCNRIREVIATLPAKQKRVADAYFFEDKNLPEIAAEMGVTKSWTSKLLTAALASLRSKFAEPEGRPPPGSARALTMRGPR